MSRPHLPPIHGAAMTVTTLTNRQMIGTGERLAVRIPSGRLVSLGAYVAGWRKVAALAATDPDARVHGWDYFAEDAWRVLRDLRDGMHDRINRHIAGYGIGRKWDADWQRAARHCANEVNHPRLIVRYVPPDLRARLAHRIHRED